MAAIRPDNDLIAMNGARLLTSGHQRCSAAGTISAVSYRAELRPTAWQVLSHLVDPRAAVVARSRLTGGRPIAEFEEAGAADSAWSVESAIAAAATVLGQPVQEFGRGALIEGLSEATIGLRCADLVTAVDGKLVQTARQLSAALAGADHAQLTVLRDRQRGHLSMIVEVPLARHLDGTWGIRFITAGRVLQHGVDASFNLPEGLYGPSVGLACALSVIDAFTDGQLAAGGDVVATGMVDMEGRVGGVGAIEYKAHAVRAHPHIRYFIVPADPASDAELARRVLGGRAEVVTVATLAEAVEILGGRSWQGMKRPGLAPGSALDSIAP